MGTLGAKPVEASRRGGLAGHREPTLLVASFGLGDLAVDQQRPGQRFGGWGKLGSQSADLGCCCPNPVVQRDRHRRTSTAPRTRRSSRSMDCRDGGRRWTDLGHGRSKTDLRQGCGCLGQLIQAAGHLPLLLHRLPHPLAWVRALLAGRQADLTGLCGIEQKHGRKGQRLCNPFRRAGFTRSSRLVLAEQFWPQLLRGVRKGADQHVIGFFRVKNVVGLKPETPITGHEFVGGNAHAGEFGQQAKRALKPGVVSISLILAESLVRISINFEKL